MQHARTTATPLCTLALLLALAAPLAAAGPEQTGKAFDVKVADGVVNVTFALALSETPTYPVTITAICCSTEEILYEGTLAEGVYRFSAPLKKISGHGELKVVLKTKMTNRKDKVSDVFLVYQTWQGPM